MLADVPGDPQICQLTHRWRTLTDHLEITHELHVCVLDQHPTAHRPKFHALPPGLAHGCGEDAEVPGLLLQMLQRLGLISRRNDDLVEHARLPVGGAAHLAEGLGELHVDDAVDGDDATVGGDEVTLAQRTLVEAAQGCTRPCREARGVGVLDDGDRRLLEVGDHVVGGVGVEDVHIGHRLAVVLIEPADTLQRLLHGVQRVERPLLVGILAVAQHLPAGHADGQLRWEYLALVTQVLGDRRVVVGDMLERLRGQPPAGLGVDAGRIAACRPQRIEDRRVVLGVDHGQDVRVVLGRRADHRRAADVDPLERVGKGGRALRHRLDKRVQVPRDEVDRRHVVLRDLGLIVRATAPVEDAAVDLRMQRLHAAAQHLRAACEVGHLCDRESRLGDRPRRAARPDELPAEVMEPAGKVNDPGLVVHREDGASLHGHVQTPFLNDS